MIKSFSGQVVFCFAILRDISAYVGENWLSQYTAPRGRLRRYQITTATSEVIPRGKCFGSARVQTQNSWVTVDHSNHVAKELTQQRGC